MDVFRTYNNHCYILYYYTFIGYRGHSTVTNYIFHPEKLSWNEARQVCENNGGTLAKIETMALHKLIYDVAMDTHKTNILYVHNCLLK